MSLGRKKRPVFAADARLSTQRARRKLHICVNICERRAYSIGAVMAAITLFFPHPDHGLATMARRRSFHRACGQAPEHVPYNCGKLLTFIGHCRSLDIAPLADWCRGIGLHRSLNSLLELSNLSLIPPISILPERLLPHPDLYPAAMVSYQTDLSSELALVAWWG